jgi:hypothetical protein
MQPEGLEGDHNATFPDDCSDNDGVCGITGVSPRQCLGGLWADEGGKSVLHAGSQLGTRPRLWQLGRMPRARERRCCAEATQDPSPSVAPNEDSLKLARVPIRSNHISIVVMPAPETPRRVTRRDPVFAWGIHVFLAAPSLPSPACREGRERADMHARDKAWPTRLGRQRLGHHSE